jgi:hypothetical protein
VRLHQLDHLDVEQNLDDLVRRLDVEQNLDDLVRRLDVRS